MRKHTQIHLAFSFRTVPQRTEPSQNGPYGFGYCIRLVKAKQVRWVTTAREELPCGLANGEPGRATGQIGGLGNGDGVATVAGDPVMSAAPALNMDCEARAGPLVRGEDPQAYARLSNGSMLSPTRMGPACFSSERPFHNGAGVMVFGSCDSLR